MAQWGFARLADRLSQCEFFLKLFSPTKLRFLHEEESLEYKYYKLKLAEMERLMATPKEEPKEEKTLEEHSSESVRRMLYARKVASIKRKLFKRKQPGILQRAARARKARKATVGTQTLLSAGTMLKQQRLHSQGSAMSSEEGSSANNASPPISGRDPDEPPSEEDGQAARPCEEAEGPGPDMSLAGQFPDGK